MGQQVRGLDVNAMAEFLRDQGAPTREAFWSMARTPGVVHKILGMCSDRFPPYTSTVLQELFEQRKACTEDRAVIVPIVVSVILTLLSCSRLSFLKQTTHYNNNKMPPVRRSPHTCPHRALAVPRI